MAVRSEIGSARDSGYPAAITPPKRVACESKHSRKVFFAFIGDEMLQEFGRLPYPLLLSFVRAGFEVLVLDNLEERLCRAHGCVAADLPQPAQLTLSIQGVRYTREIPESSADYWYVFDRPLPSAKPRPWRKRVRIGFDLFSRYWLRTPVIAPYAMFPAHAEHATTERLSELRRTPRRMRAYFAGDSKGYVRTWVQYPAPKLPRQEVLDIVRGGLRSDLVEVSHADEIDLLCEAGYVNKFVLSASGSGIPQSRWLATMASADFFLCPPGIVMPMCHNVVEAMAVGTIPLIGYPEWLQPKLRPGQDCVAFEGRDDLVDKMRRVLAMPPAEVARMRERVIEYYETHLRPGVVVDAIEARPEREVTLLMHTELNMARHSARLNRRSVLIQGPDGDGPLRRIARNVDRLVDRFRTA